LRGDTLFFSKKMGRQGEKSYVNPTAKKKEKKNLTQRKFKKSSKISLEKSSKGENDAGP